MTPKQIKEIRLKARLSQAGLAEVFDTHPMTISKWERGERTPDGAAVAALKAIRWAVKEGKAEELLDAFRR
ncbi:MAG: hypothetical protein DBP02_15040 [gamma proteobacterium symbiont of Ctena orbiculata]|nr:MAG: hypothetical protein DBP02_15040 [gamma proteobacterium symbiont of Ctena orbiculata]